MSFLGSQDLNQNCQYQQQYINFIQFSQTQSKKLFNKSKQKSNENQDYTTISIVQILSIIYIFIIFQASMVLRYYEPWNHCKIAEKALMDSIMAHQNPILAIQSNLENQDMSLLQLRDRTHIKQLKKYCINQLHNQITFLKNKVIAGQLIQNEPGINRILVILYKLAENSSFQKDQTQMEPAYQLALKWCSTSKTVENVFKLIIKNSFNKEHSALFYYFLYYMENINLYDDSDRPISLMLQANKALKMHFLKQQTNQDVKIEIPDLVKYMQDNKLSNWYQLSRKIFQEKNLSPEDEDKFYLALETKSKMILFEDRIGTVNSILFSYEIFSIIDIAWFKSETDMSSVPNIFTLPPNYPIFFEDMLSMLFKKTVNKEIHHSIFQVINKIILIEQKQVNRYYASRQILGALAQMSSGHILNILLQIQRVIKGQEPQLIPPQTIKDQIFINKVLKLVADRIGQTKTLFTYAQNIAKTIFKNQPQKNYSEQLIENAGKILIGIEIKEEQIIQILLKKIQRNSKYLLPYLNILNTLFSIKYSRQRRDFGLIARNIAQSNIFIELRPSIQKQLNEGKQINQKSIIIETSKLINNICAESALLVDQIENQGQIISFFLEIFQKIDILPNKSEDIAQYLNFFYNISLRQSSQMRKKAIVEPLPNFLQQIFTSQRTINSLLEKPVSGNLAKLIDNINISAASICQGIKRAFFILLKQYNQINSEPINLANKTHEQKLVFYNRVSKADAKLCIILRHIDKIRDVLLPLCLETTLQNLLKILQQFAFGYQYAMLDVQAQDRLLISILRDVTKRVDSEEKQRKSLILNELAEEEKANISPIYQINVQQQVGQAIKQNQIEQINPINYSSDDQFIEDLIKQQEIFVRILKLARQLALKIDLNKKLNFIPRKFHQVLLSGQYVSSNQLEISLIKTVPIFQRYLHLKIKVGGEKYSFQENYQLLQELYPIFIIQQQILANYNSKVIRENLNKIQTAIFQPKIHINHSDFQVLSENNLCRELYQRLLQNFTAYHSFTQSYIKTLAQFNQKIHILPQQGKIYHKKINKFLTTFYERAMKYMNQDLKDKNPFDLQGVEHLRFIIRISLQVLILRETAEARENTNFNSPANKLIFAHLYYLEEGQISFFDVTNKMIQIFTKTLQDRKFWYEDTEANRQECIMFSLLKIMFTKIKSLLNYAYKINSLLFIDQSIPEQKQEEIKKINYYIQAKLHNYYIDILTSQQRIVAQPIKALNEMNRQIIGKLYDKQTFSNFFKIEQWQFLSSFNIIQSASLDEQGFIRNFQLGSEKLIFWYFENLDWKIPNLDYILEKIISRFARIEQLGPHSDLENPVKQKIWKIHDKVSDCIIVLAKQLFPTLSLDLGRRYPSLKKEVNYQTLSIPIQTRKFGNLIIFVIQALKFYTKFRLYHKGNLTIHSNYIQSIIKIACSLMLSFQQLIQNNEPIHNEANQLTLIIINLLDIYFQYDKQLKQYRQRIRKEKNKSKNKLKNLKYKKKRRILRKKVQIENQNESNLIEELGQNKQKKSKKKKYKRNGPISVDELRAQSSVLQSNPQQSLKKIKSIANLHAPEKSIKKHATMKKPKKSKKNKIPLSSYFTEYIKIVFEVASNHAFLKTKTLQTMLKLINFIINPRNNKETSNIIQLAPEQLIKSLFKVKVKDRTNEGLFYQLCQFGVFLLNVNHINFDLQLSIKRYFFDNLPKKEVKLKQFFQFCNFNELKADIKTVTRLVEIIVKQPEHDKQKKKAKITPKQIQKKPELQRPEILSEKKFGQSSARQLSDHEESEKSNLKIFPFKLNDVFKHVNNPNAYVRLQKNCQFGQFNSQLPNKQEKPRRKQSGNQEDRNNQLRTVFKFVPEGNVQLFINEAIENIVRICVRELKDTYLKTNNLFMQPDSRKQQHLFQLDAFNLSVLIKSLQVMGRYSPSLTAYIYRFKLNKIVSEQYQKQSISKELKEKINMILYQKIQPPKEDSSAPQVTFYTFLMRIIMPFSTSFGSALIFEMCLDNLPLVQIPDKVVSLGHIIRIKTINQIKKGILNKQSIIRKFCSLTLLTGLLSIRQFAICCFESGMQHFLQEQYIKILQKTNLFKQVINPYFIKPLQLLQELSVYLYLQKKTNKPPITKIKLLRGLDSNNLKNQLISKYCLGKLKDKFYHSWPFSQIGQTIEGQGDDDEDQLSSDGMLSEQEQQDSNLSLSIFSNPRQDFIEQNPDLQNQSGNSWVIHQPLSNDEQMIPEQDMSDQHINIQELQNLPIDQVILQGISDNIDQENIQPQEGHSLSDEQDMLQGNSQSFQDNLSDFDEIDEEDEFQNDSQEEMLSQALRNQNLLKFMGQDKDLYEQFEEIIVSSEKLNNLQPISQAITQQVKILHCCFKLKDTPKTHPKFNELHKQFNDVLKFIESNDVYFNECKQITFKHFVMIQNLTYARPVEGPITLSFDEDDPYYRAPQSFGLETLNNRRLPRNGFIRIASGQIDPSGHRIIRLDRLNLGQLRQDFIHSRPPTIERNPQRNQRNEQEDQEQEQRNALQHQNFVVRINNEGPTLMEVLGDNNQNFPPQLIAQTGMSEAQFNNLPRAIQQQIIEQLNLRQLYGDQYMNEMNEGNPQINQMDQQLDDDIEDQQDGSEQQHLPRENMNQLIEEQSGHIEHNRNLEQNNLANQIMIQVPEQENQNNHIIKKMLKENPKLDQYFKLANQYKKKIDKDLFFILNNKGKKNHKFHCYSDEFLENFLYLIYFLDQSTYIEFPYRLLENLLIHTDNCEKILSTLLQILKLGPKIKLQSSFKIKGCIPTTIIMGSNHQLIDSYQQLGYSKLALKIIHLFSIVSNHFSISSRMLQFQNNPINSMKKVMALVQQKQQQQDNNFLQNFIGLLEYEQISDDQVTFSFFIDTLRNITHNNYLNSCTQFFERQKAKYIQAKKKQKKKKQKTNQEIKDNVQQQRKQEQMDSYQLLYNDPKLLLSKKSIKLLCEVLLKEELKFNSHIVSKIIIRFCSNIDNLKEFIANFKRMIDEKAQQEIQNLSKMKNPEYLHQLNANIQQSKIVSILTVLGQILKVVSHQKSQSQNICEQFLSIISSKSLRKMCETGLDLISVQNSHTQLANKISQVLDSFVIIYKMISDVTKTNQQQVVELSKKMQIQNVSQSTPKLKQKSNSKIILEDFDMQSLWQNKICTPLGRIFINSLIKKKIRSTMKSIKNSKMSIFDIPIVSMAIKTPHMLQFDNKKALFKVQMYRVNRRHYGSLDLYIRRDQVFQQSFTQIMSRRPQQLKGKINIKFENEPGQDAGGLSRQWFQLLSKQMFNPNYALFKPSSAGNTYQPSPISYVNSDHLLYFKFIGKIMGKALSDGFMLDAYFTPAFYKHLLGLPITYLDMQEEDFEFYNSLKWILDKNNCPIQDYIQLYFAHEVDNLGEIVTKELIPNGSQIKVTESNKMQYVQQITKYKMVQAVKNQYQALLSGFHEFIPSKIVKIFEPKELQLMISGLPTIDISDLKKNTDLRIYARTDNVIIWLFEALEEFDMQLRAAFVQFVTGTSKVPVDGFKALRGVNGPQKFNIQKIYERNTFPRAHTCFNQLDLPEYDSKQILVKKLTEAIISGKQGFGFD